MNATSPPVLPESPDDRPNPPEVTVAESKASPGARLAFVDGLRGLAIFLVLLRHFYMGIYSKDLPRPADLMGLGYLGVHLFLLLSGFCVAWAFVGTRPRDMSLSEFVSRRAARILPAYYVALVLFLFLAPRMSGRELFWQLFTHITMTHNLSPTTTLAINGVFWSLALECQLYLTFPLILEGYRRRGPLFTLTVMFLFQLGFRLWVAKIYGTQLGPLDETLPWSVWGRVSEFGLGVWAAILVGRSAKQPFSASARLAFPILALVCFAVGDIAKRKLGVTAPLTDLGWSLGFFWLLLAGSVEGSILDRVLSWRPLVGLGVISYSVYLMHNLALTNLTQVFMRASFGPHLPSLSMLYFGIIPVLAGAVAFSYVFYRLVEKPSIDYFARKRKSVKPAFAAKPESSAPV